MVNQQQFNDGLEKLRTDLTTLINDSLQSIKDTIISNLVTANKSLQQKVEALEEKVVGLETELQASLQYTRQNNLLISGISEDIDHGALEEIAMKIINKCSAAYQVVEDDIEACHRLSARNSDVVCRLINRKGVEDALNNRSKMKNLNDVDKEALGLPKENGQIYLNEHLTRHNSQLAFFCRRLKKNEHISNLSTKKGVVKIQGQFGGPSDTTLTWRKIAHVNDLHKLFPDLDAKIVLP